MGVGADRHEDTGLLRHPQQLDVEVLPVQMGIDLKGLARSRSRAHHERPVRAQAQPDVVPAPPRMGQHLDVGIAERRQVALGLIVGDAKLGVERAEDEIERRQGSGVHVALAGR
jgi:hypothetical protein